MKYLNLTFYFNYLICSGIKITQDINLYKLDGGIRKGYYTI